MAYGVFFIGNTDAMLAEFGNVTDVHAKHESDARAQMEDGLKVMNAAHPIFHYTPE